VPASETKKRFRVLDQLRGFFIVVIIIDHLSRWPSLWSAITGKAWLWVTAAEGFVIISGLLVGYVRGFKNRSQSFQNVSGLLIRRGLLLYLWSIIGAVAYTAIIWYVPLQGGAPGVDIEKGQWFELFSKSLLLQYTSVWTHFLSLYAVFLIASPIAIWLFRQNKAWAVVVISFVLLGIGWMTKSEMLQWQFLFFIPCVAGFYLETIGAWWQKQTAQTRRRITVTTITTMALTMAISVIVTFYPSLAPVIAQLSQPFFEKDSISLARAAMAFLWFIGVYFVFTHLARFITKGLGWLLEPIGTHSLTAYIVHGLVLCSISFFTLSGSNFIINTLLGAIAVIAVWAIIKTPGINRVIPR
jgi:hypothetical protein